MATFLLLKARCHVHLCPPSHNPHPFSVPRACLSTPATHTDLLHRLGIFLLSRAHSTRPARVVALAAERVPWKEGLPGCVRRAEDLTPSFTR
jgi:hypothetical protein